jgi:hypothetical protein
MIPDDVFVLDSVVHAYNTDESNFRIPEYASHITDMVYDTFMTRAPEHLTLSEEEYNRDWGVEESVNMLFLESQTDFAVFHPTPINAYEDGMTSVEKAKEAVQRWPNRFRTMATVDPLEGEEALAEFERQAEEMDPIGLKLYPSSWADGTHSSWNMGDSDIVYPFYEKAAELGIDLIAVHKALPLGSVPMEDYHSEDVDVAATNFPELNFSVVHGGMTFNEEASWQLARYDNIFVNLEVLVYMAHVRPEYFADKFAGLFEVGGEGVIDQIYWGSGSMAYPAQPQLEAFWDFEFPERFRSRGHFDVPEMNRENKEKILGKNYTRMAGLDIEELKDGIRDDEFSAQREDGLAPPYSTTAVGD